MYLWSISSRTWSYWFEYQGITTAITVAVYLLIFRSGWGKKVRAVMSNRTMAGAVGSLQAVEVIKEILGIGESLAGRLLLIDALGAGFRTLRRVVLEEPYRALGAGFPADSGFFPCYGRPDPYPMVARGGG